MKAIYLDCFAGISGNMLLGAFLQAGLPEEYLTRELRKVLPPDEFSIEASDVSKNGIRAKYVRVLVNGEPAEFHAVEPSATHGHDHCGHEHDGEQEQCHEHQHEHEHGHAHTHRTMATIRDMIEGSMLGEKVKETSLSIFERLAEAEGKVHGVPADEVHFHEVGATDSIADIVGTAIALDYFGVEKVFVSKVNTGSGFVECAHGTIPVPAPATAELLAGFPFYHAADEKEMTTPTGAAVIRALGEFAENLPGDFQPEAIAYGAGTWELSIPNVLRVYVGDYQGKEARRLYLLETNIDDMNPQDYGYVYERLLAAGALDVWTTPIFMKKNRPASALSVLVGESEKDKCADLLFRETTSIGLRVVPVGERLEAARRTATVETPYGEVSCKISAYKGQIVSLSAEYEDCRRLAQEKDVPLKKVRDAAIAELRRRLGE
ncbi:MAG: nickel pincer cofactor biosynthesis protein LarC [Schwartzia sp.]|nr:nickel pincer cofactor biosynthesis protein LarC [Schwartzia sp. (in: firmicutes)]